ncbi:MAG: hypothetical protein HZA22_02260 [Nitrospirae bacterium]|nr:hypothetical protein [Nitrospirota bacterium]
MRRANLLYLTGMLVIALCVFAGPAKGMAAYRDYISTVGTGGISQPAKVAVDSATGDVYVTDSGNKAVKKYNKDGVNDGAFALSVAGTPVGIAVTTGNIFVGDDTNNCVWIYNKSGALADLSGTGTSHMLGGASATAMLMPNTVAVSPGGHIFVVDGDSDKIYIFNATGAANSNFGTSGTTSSGTTIQCYFPSGLAFAGSTGTTTITQTFYLGDQGNYKVQKLTYAYNASTKAITTAPTYVSTVGSGARGDGFGTFLRVSDVVWDSFFSRLIVIDSLQMVGQVFDSNGATTNTAFNYSGSVQGYLNVPTGAAAYIGPGSTLFVANNQGDSLSLFRLSDGALPAITALSPATDTTPNATPYSIAYTVTDADSSAITMSFYYHPAADPASKTLLGTSPVTLVGGTYSGTYNWSWATLPLGSYKVYATAVDSNNNLVGATSAGSLLVVTDYDSCTGYSNAMYALYGGAATDYDGDGLTNCSELNGTQNTAFGNQATDMAVADSDGDGLDDGDECLTYSTDPNTEDTDAGGVKDGAEVLRGTDPLSAGDDPDPTSKLVGMYYTFQSGTPTATQAWNTLFVVTNPTANTVSGTLYIYDMAGSQTYSGALTFDPHERKNIDPSTYPGSATTGSIEIDAVGGVLIGNEYISVTDSGALRDEHSVAMKPYSTGSNTLYVPLWARLINGAGVDSITNINLKNPGDSLTTAHATIYDKNNVILLEQDIPVAAHGAVRWKPFDYGVIDTKGNVVITCPDPILGFLTNDKLVNATQLYNTLSSYELLTPDDNVSIFYSTIWTQVSPWVTWFSFKNTSASAKTLTEKWYDKNGLWILNSSDNYAANGNLGFNAGQKGIVNPPNNKGTGTYSSTTECFIGYYDYVNGTEFAYDFQAPIYSGNLLYVSGFYNVEGANGYSSYLSLVNPNSEAVLVTYDWYTESGTLERTTTYSIPAGGTYGVNPATAGVTASRGSAVVRTPLPVKGFINRLTSTGIGGAAWLFEYHPQPPSGLKTTSQVGSIKVDWTLSADDPLNTLGQPKGAMDVTYYRILRSVTLGGGYSQIGQVPAGTATYTDSQVSPATNYYYKVQATTDGTILSETAESAAVQAQ